MKTKICTKCGKEKELKEFYFRKDSNSYRNECKKCIIERNQNFKKNIVPWRKHFYSARRRCENPKDSRYKDYGQRGIKFLLTMNEIKKLWNKDKAWLLKKPSIDRKENDGNYELDNCQFIELRINSLYNKRQRKGKHILQLNKNNKIIADFISIKATSRKTNIPDSKISLVVNKKRLTAGGYIWRYYE